MREDRKRKTTTIIIISLLLLLLHISFLLHFSGSSVQYDFVYIDDVLNSIEEALQHTTGSDSSCVSAIFNVGNGVGMALTEVAKMLMQELKKEVKIVSIIIIIVVV